MKKLKILIIGSGGREHALGWKIKQSRRVGKLYFAPGNAGTSSLGKNVEISATDIDRLVDFAISEKIDFTVVGPDDSLAVGIVNTFQQNGLAIFGPTKEATKIESSKAFAKQLMLEEGIPTAAFATFINIDKAKKYLEIQQFPVVIKASGLALGKGVIIAKTFIEAEKALEDIMEKKVFGQAGDEVVIEEFLEGKEISVHAFCDGKAAKIFPLARDHKTIYENNLGPNTGGMGTIASLSEIPETIHKQIEEIIIKPILKGMQKKGIPFTGCLYPGLILTKHGPKVLEFNARFGDPETQSYMRLLKTDLIEIMQACVEGKLSQTDIVWDKHFACCIVLASSGYPGNYNKGETIYGLSTIQKNDIVVFHAGTKKDGTKIVTSGGRVVGITATGKTLELALVKVYGAIGKKGLHFNGMQYRKDIGRAAPITQNEKVINGTKHASAHELILKNRLKKIRIKPHVVSILIGNDSPSVLYTQMKQKKAAQLGIDFEPVHLLETVSYKEVEKMVNSLNDDPKIHGIMFQLPFPKAFMVVNPDANNLMQKIIPEKDMDGLSTRRLVLPAAVQASISILHDEKISLQGKRTVVLGASELVGKPAGQALKQLGAFVEICNSKTKNLLRKTKLAELIICATGVPGILTGEMVSDGVIIIDIGAEKRAGKVVGDADFISVAKKASKITPVPGGVGPMTVISLMENIFELVKNKKE